MTDIAARMTARMTGPVPKPLDAELARLWEIHGGRVQLIADEMGLTQGQVSGRSRILGLQFHGDRGRVLDAVHPTSISGRSVFASRVAAPERGLLKSGDNQRKLGKWVTKGPWKGMPIYSL